MQVATSVISFLVLLAIIWGVWVARKELRLETATRRAEFLNVLDHRFCTEDGFARTRREIRNQKLVIDPKNDIAIRDYLGFFEVLNVFRKGDIIAPEDIYSQFGIYIREAYNNEAISKLLEREKDQWSGFREITQKMQELGKEEQAMQKGKDKKGK